MDPEENHFDIIVIGGGSAGYAAARIAAEEKKRIAIVDGAKELGGLCILRGCMPSKTLMYSAEVAHNAQKAERIGLTPSKVKVDMEVLQQRKKELVAEFASYRESQLKSERFTLFNQNARFLDHLTIALDDGTEYWADKYVIATGSKISTPAIQGLKETPHWTSDDVLNLTEIPESVIVLGGGVVACELAQFLNRAGSKVTLIQRSPFVLKAFSPEASAVVEQAMRDEGIRVFTHTSIEAIKTLGEGVMVQFKSGYSQHIVHAEKLLNALGRQPNVEALDLDNADIQLSSSGFIETNVYQQTTNPAVYAVGDCAGPYEVVHVGIMQGELAAKHALGLNFHALDYDVVMSVVFTDPQIASVGLTWQELEERDIDYIEASYPFCDHGKSMLMDANYGYVKIWARRSDCKILGAECVGKDASELIHTMNMAVATGQSAGDMLKAHWYHPTLAEIWTYPLEEILEAES